jgi:hypothetical protein
MLDIKIKPYLLPLIYSCNVFSITLFVMEAYLHKVIAKDLHYYRVEIQHEA